MREQPAEVNCTKGDGERWQKQLWLLVLPLAFLGLYSVFLSARGPFWIRPTADPDYPYLFNALNVATGRAPRHTDHPGITLQVWGALMLKAVHVSSSGDALAKRVLQEPERHLRWISHSLAGIYSLCLLVCGTYLWRLTGERLSAVVVQSVPFLLGSFFPVTTRVSPEPVLLILGLLLMTLLYAHTATKAQTFTPALAFGALAATALVTKLTFAPLALVPLIALRTWKERGLYIISGVLLTVCWLIPLSGQTQRLVDWLINLATRQERYGSGEFGLVPGDYVSNLILLLQRHPWMALAVGLSWLSIFWPRSGTQHQSSSHRRLLVALTLGQTLQIAMVAKYTQSRYLIPTVMLCPLNVLLLWHTLRLKWEDQSWWRNVRLTGAVAAGIGLVPLGWELQRQYQSLARAARDRTGVAQRIQNDFRGETIVLVGVASSPYYAMWFGNFWAGAHYTPLLRDRLLKKHGRVYYLEGDNWIWLAGERFSPLADFIRAQRTFVLSGNARHERRIAKQLPPGTKLERLENRSGEAIYRVQMDTAEVSSRSAL